jgi:Family of unknown function (DUF6311)/Carbohydrate binding domain
VVVFFHWHVPLMGTGPTPSAANLLDKHVVSAARVKAGPRVRWLDSLWFDLALAFVAGLLYALIVMGPGPLNPRNVDWVTVDPAYHYIGWELLRQDPQLHWPLTYTDRLGYPKGESVALLDLNPLAAVMLRPLSPLLPEPFQYFGIEVVLACALQFFFAFRIFRLTLGTDVLGNALCSVFFLLAPPLNYRFMGHYSLSNHWLLLAVLLVFLQVQTGIGYPTQPKEGWVGHPADRSAIRRFVIAGAALTAISVGINPYIAFQVLAVLTAGVVSLLWQRKVTLARAAGVMVLFCAAGFVVAYSLGLVIEGGRGYQSGGYRVFSMNLLSLGDPRGWSSILLPRISSATSGQYEGYNYLGVGVLLLALIVVVVGVLQRRKLRVLDRRWLIPLLLCCGALTLLALSTKVTLASRTIVDLDPSEKLSPYLASLRASGRLFWTPYYLILVAVLAVPFLFFKRLWANLIIGCALLLQIADTQSLRHWVHTTISEQHPSPLRSPIWSTLGAMHQNLIVLPAWQCNGSAAPLGPESYRIFGFLAVSQKMRTNSYQSARYTEVARDWHCHQAIDALSEQPLSPESAYVVTPELAARIAAGPSGPGKCHDLDRVILCSTRTDFGLSPVLMTPEERLESSVANPGFEDGDLSPWSPVWEVGASASSARARSGSHSLAEAGLGSVYQDVTGLEPGGTYIASAWVSGSPDATAQVQITIYDPSANGSTSSPFVSVGPDWRSLYCSFTAGRDGTIRLHLLRGPGSGTIYWDDIHISREK